MGFLNAVRDIGRVQTAGMEEDSTVKFSQLPMIPIVQKSRNDQQETKKEQVIQVWLRTADPFAEVLDIQGIDRFRVVDYLADGLSVVARQEQKRRMLFKEPSGNNVTWSYSPIYRLGKPKRNSLRELLEEKGRLERLQKTTLNNYEKEGVFAPGSVDLLMNALHEQSGTLAELWSDTERSYLLMFGISHQDSFLYPGDIPAFVSYFRDKVKRQVFDGAFSSPCALCQTSSVACVNLDTVFKFATFDKPGYLPGIGSSGKDKSAAKVFPACIDCYSALLVGREELDVQFCDRRTISGINIYVVPELITGTERMDAATRVATGFITEGVAGKESVFSSLARRDELLVFHFVFWESNQAQERIHLMVEDVPPSYLRFLEDTWLETADVFGIKEDGRRTLDGAFRTLFRATRSFAGERQQDKNVMTEYTISLIGKLLNNEWVDSKMMKTLAVSRMPGLVNDPKWMKYASNNVRELGALVDFLDRYNGRR